MLILPLKLIKNRHIVKTSLIFCKLTIVLFCFKLLFLVPPSWVHANRFRTCAQNVVSCDQHGNEPDSQAYSSIVHGLQNNINIHNYIKKLYLPFVFVFISIQFEG